MHECMIKDSPKFILQISIMKKGNQIILCRNLKSDFPKTRAILMPKLQLFVSVIKIREESNHLWNP
jgi:hypothetical protein